MKYTEFKIYTTSDALDDLLARLTAAGQEQLVIGDPRDAESFAGDGSGYAWNYIDDALLAELKSAAWASFYLPEGERLSPELAALLKDYDVKKTVTDDRDWLYKWEEYYVPVKISERVVAKPIHRPYEPKKGETVVEIDPGLAFGTGLSATTYLTARLLDKYLEPGQTVFDVGCGTGILSVMAVKLGASHVLALDLDPEAIASTEKNAKGNGCRKQIEIRTADLLNGVHGEADLIAANLMPDLLLRLLEQVRSHLAPGGLLVCGGVIDKREEEIRAAIEAAGFEILERAADDCWRSFAARLQSCA